MEHNSTIATNSLKFISCHKASKHASGSAVQDYINTSYHNLVNHFGKPTIKTDGYKTSSEWHVEIEKSGTVHGVVTIYDYKQCKTYAGDNGLEPEQITEWHVGAKNHKLANLVINLIDNNWAE